MSNPDPIDEGLAHQHAGRIVEAKAAYQAALNANPHDPDALHLLGLLYHQQGDFEAAIQTISQAVELDPSAASFRHNLGEALRSNKQPREAIAAYHQALNLDDSLAATWSGLGLASQEAGDPSQAVTAWRKALAHDPRDAATLNNLAVAYRHLGQPVDAVQTLREAIAIGEPSPEMMENLVSAFVEAREPQAAIDQARQFIELFPDLPQAHVTLAGALLAAKQYEPALDACRDAIRLDPDSIPAHFSLGCEFLAMHQYYGALLAFKKCDQLKPEQIVVLVNTGQALVGIGQLAQAIEHFRRALVLDPKQYAAHLNLSNALHSAGKIDEAVLAAHEALSIWPQNMAVLNLLATLLTRQGKNAEADQYFKQALSINPDDGFILSNYGLMLGQYARIPEAIAALKKSRSLRPEDFTPHSVLLLYINASHEATPQEIAREHRDWGVRYADPLTAQSPLHPPGDPEKPKLRVGYVSPDWRIHSVGYFIEPILACHDHSQVEVVVYDDVIAPDMMTHHLRNYADEWHRVIALSYEQLAEKIRSDRIDILVELTGHTASNRLLTFARKPAPVQVSYLGYPFSTGIKAIDYHITDAIVDPPGQSEHLHVEKLVRPSNSFVTFRAASEAPPLAPLPARTNGYITFCSFNAIWKFNPFLCSIWSNVLHRVPRSKLLIKAGGLNDAETHARVLQAFEANGIGPERLELHARAPAYAGHLQMYNRCDIQLDSTPYNGTTTTCEGLWMGVPAITLLGDAPAARVGASLCTTVGLEQCIAQSPDEFVKLAVDLASDLDRLENLRSTMRERMIASPLLDARGFTQRLEDCYRTMWRQWCNSTPTPQTASDQQSSL